MDYRLQEAVYTLNKDICGTCGNPVWLCHSADGRIEFEIQTKACYAKAEIDTYEKDERNAIPLEPGEYRVAVAVGLENEDGTRDPLPSRREAMEQM